MTSTPTATDPTLRQGDSGAAVSELQQLLNAKGINITVDGVFGNATRAAVVQFQQQNGLASLTPKLGKPFVEVAPFN